MLNFPIYKNNYKPVIELSKFQKQHIDKMIKDINSGKLNLVQNYCLCGNKNLSNDILISEIDRYGIPVRNKICHKCGLIISNKVFDTTSNKAFYQKYYRNIYVGNDQPLDSFFNEQVIRGQEFLKLLTSKMNINNIENILEIGCGAGGILFPFFQNHQNTIGVDYDKDYLEFGKQKGLNLFFGDYGSVVKEESQDLIILSHVMEHFLDPITEVQNIIRLLKPKGYLLVEVPGIFHIDKVYHNPLTYLQNAHIYNYYYDFLKVFFNAMDVDIIYGDEKCVFIIQKPNNWICKKIKYVYSPLLKPFSIKIRKYILKQSVLYRLLIHPQVWKTRIGSILKLMGVKETVKTILKKYNQG